MNGFLYIIVTMKQFLVIGNAWSIIYKDLFPLFRDRVFWFGRTHRGIDFILPDGTVKNVNAAWFTNIEIDKGIRPLDLSKVRYDPSIHHKYDNYDVIDIPRSNLIPCDYDGVMGVPISFLDRWCPSQFDLIGIATGNSWENYPETLKALGFNPDIYPGGGLGSAILNGKAQYVRLFIKRK